MAILSIQSAVAYGHVGNSAAMFPLQRLGFEVWPVDTVQFSNHTGYGQWRGRAWDAVAISEVIRGVAERGVLPRCEAVLSGYLGDVALGEVVLEAVAAVKAANPTALYCCDPVIGDDHSGIFVAPEIPAFFRDRAVAAADILTPNRFELALLSGREIAGVADALGAAAALRARGPRLILVTSLPGDNAKEIAMLAAGKDGGWLVATPRLPHVFNGAGDLTAAVFLGQYLRVRDPAAALAATAASVYAVLEETLGRGTPELAIVAAQATLADPVRQFPVRRVG
ncbi:MAG TPA: pyridoxal kinase PdxY [Stellaceae bacterium]|nr:pyridoxal kinase PdxY [Stellaceae bacterium]